jgi:hypothetical protein
MNGTDGAPKTKRINGKTYRLEGTDLRQEQIDDLRKQGYSVRTVCNKMYRETYTYIK